MINLKNMFSSITPHYDLLNHILSLGLDFYWRKKMVFLAHEHFKKNEFSLLDLACGTGDVAFAFSCFENIKPIVASDFCSEMVDIAVRKNRCKHICFSITDAHNINFKDKSFNLVTNAFALRNIKELQKSFEEMKRVLKPGGLCLSLEFGKPENIFFKPFYLLYLNYILPLIGAVISLNYDAYKYLAASIRQFMSPHEVCELFRLAGFKEVRYIPLTLGIVNIYIAKI